MIVNYTTADGRMSVQIEGKTQTDIWEQIAAFQDTFETGPCVRGKKSSTNIKYQVREVEDNKYYELVCTDPDFDLKGARLSFGQHKKGGTLFAKRKDKDGKWLDNNGWLRYNKETGKEE